MQNSVSYGHMGRLRGEIGGGVTQQQYEKRRVNFHTVEAPKRVKTWGEKKGTITRNLKERRTGVLSLILKTLGKLIHQIEPDTCFNTINQFTGGVDSESPFSGGGEEGRVTKVRAKWKNDKIKLLDLQRVREGRRSTKGFRYIREANDS